MTKHKIVRVQNPENEELVNPSIIELNNLLIEGWVVKSVVTLKTANFGDCSDYLLEKGGGVKLYSADYVDRKIQEDRKRMKDLIKITHEYNKLGEHIYGVDTSAFDSEPINI